MKRTRHRRPVFETLRRIWEHFLFAIGCDGEVRREYVDAGLLDFSGQGKDEYGK